MIKNVFIFTRPGADTTISDSLLIDVGDAVRDKGLYMLTRQSEVDKNTLVLALGGDGTMITAIRIASDHGAYVTGFNYGHLGYLVPSTARSSTELVSKLNAIIDDVNEDQPLAYKTVNYTLPILHWFKTYAVNDFYFVPAARGTAADFRVTIGNDNSYFETKSSGIVVATPFGSTGLALSSGGSIISPDTRALEVVPMLPHTLTSRPIIVPDTDKITVSWDYKISVFADGQLIDDFGNGQVELSCKKRKIKLIQPDHWDFFENLKKKMSWHT